MVLTTVDLGYEKGDTLSNMVNKFTDLLVKQYFDLFEQSWQDKDKLTDVTNQVIEHISTVYKENPPEFIYFLILYKFLTNSSKTLPRICFPMKPWL